MKVVVIAQLDPNMFPALHQLAVALAERGSEVTFVSQAKPANATLGEEIAWVKLPKVEGFAARLPWFRANGHRILSILRRAGPDWIVAQNEYLIPALLYKLISGGGTKVASYLTEYQRDRKYIALVKRFAHLIDAYVDICDVRLHWRRRDWPRMKATAFVVRQAPLRRADVARDVPERSPQIVFTGSKYVLGLDRGRLSRFLSRLCERGVAVDWYLPGAEDARSTARSLATHPLYNVLGPVEKSRLMDTLERYDVGLHWAPMAEESFDPDYFNSAASNKIGEYVATGLVVAHAGNPGLAYLPEEVRVVFDPTDPEKGADQLADALLDRPALQRRRIAVQRYHEDEMNFEAQASPFVEHVMAQYQQRPKHDPAVIANGRGSSR